MSTKRMLQLGVKSGFAFGSLRRCLGQADFKCDKESRQKKQDEIHCVNGYLKRGEKNGYNLVLSPVDGQRLSRSRLAPVRIFI